MTNMTNGSVFWGGIRKFRGGVVQVSRNCSYYG